MGIIRSASTTPSGAAFPTAPSAGDRFIRSDRDYREYFYDGTRWLTTQVFSSTVDVEGASASFNRRIPVPFRGVDGGVWLDSWSIAQSTSAGAGEWDVILSWRPENSTNNVLDTRDGSGDTGGNWYYDHRDLSQVLDPTALVLYVRWAEVSGTLFEYGAVTVHFRLIG